MNKHEILHESKWFVIWALIYFVLIWLTKMLLIPQLSKLSWMHYLFVNHLIAGLFIALSSSLIYSAIKSRRFNIGAPIVYWTLIYAGLLWIIEFLISYFHSSISSIDITNPLNSIVISAIMISLASRFIKRIDFGYNTGVRPPRFSFNFLIVVAVVVIAYFYSQSAHFFVYSMMYGIPVVGYWIIIAIICFFVWKYIDN